LTPTTHLSCCHRPTATYEQEAAPESDRIDYVLEGISRFMGLFALGITVTLMARWVTALLPFYWIGAIACISPLALPASLSRSARLLAIATRPGCRHLHGLV
jgi:hypothetical protein